MKKVTLSIFFIAIFCEAFTQTLKNEKFFSKELNESILYHVWLPEGWKITKKYPVIYQYEILSISDLNSKLLVNNVSIYSVYYNKIPKTIIVSIDIKNGDEVGYTYGTGNINTKGQNFLKAVKEGIIPAVENKFNGSSKFRCFFGHSQTASYANYLFLHKPDIFNAYILLSPEKLEAQQPPFEIDEQLVQYYKNNHVTYYLADGGLDMPRRQAYAKEISEKVKKLDTSSFMFQFDSFANASHMTILTHAISQALEFIFKPYTSYLDIDTAQNALNYFKKVETELYKLYGLSIEKDNSKNNSISQFFISLAVKNKDGMALSYFADYFMSGKSSGVDLNNVAYSFNSIGWTEKAEEYYKKAIEKSRRDEKQKHSVQNKLNIFTAYRSLALNVYKDDKIKAWEILQKGLLETGEADLNYWIGRHAVENKMYLNEGIKKLLVFINSDHKESWTYFKDQAYYYLGEGYLLLNDKINAKMYLQKALEINSNNEKAKEAIKKL